jgi:hypothetical protein
MPDWLRHPVITVPLEAIGFVLFLCALCGPIVILAVLQEPTP